MNRTFAYVFFASDMARWAAKLESLDAIVSSVLLRAGVDSSPEAPELFVDLCADGLGYQQLVDDVMAAHCEGARTDDLEDRIRGELQGLLRIARTPSRMRKEALYNWLHNLPRTSACAPSTRSLNASCHATTSYPCLKARRTGRRNSSN